MKIRVLRGLASSLTNKLLTDTPADSEKTLEKLVTILTTLETEHGVTDDIAAYQDNPMHNNSAARVGGAGRGAAAAQQQRRRQLDSTVEDSPTGASSSSSRQKRSRESAQGVLINHHGYDGAQQSLSSGRQQTTEVTRQPPPLGHFAHLPMTTPAATVAAGEPLTYFRDAEGNFVAIINREVAGAGNPVATTASPDSNGNKGMVGDFMITPRAPSDSVRTLASEGALVALSRDPKKAERQGGADVFATLMNNPSSPTSEQVSTRGEGSYERRSQEQGRYIQLDICSLTAAAFNPSSFSVDQYVDVSAHMSRSETKAWCRQFQHTEKHPKKLTVKKMPFTRPADLESALTTYVELFDATVLLKPKIRDALLLLVADALLFADTAPHDQEIFRSIAAFFFQEVEHVLRRVGASTSVDAVVNMIYEIDFHDSAAAHNSCIAAYHLHQYQATKRTDNPNTTNPTNNNGAGGKAPGAGGGADAGDNLTKHQRRRAKEKEKKLQQGKDKNDNPPTPRTKICPFFCSTRGCDASRAGKFGPCKPERHALPTKEEDRVAMLGLLSKLALTARADFPTSCPP